MGSNLIDSGIADIGDIDGAMVLLRAASGALVQITNSRRCSFGYDQRVEAFGATGMLRAESDHPLRGNPDLWSGRRRRAGHRAGSVGRRRPTRPSRRRANPNLTRRNTFHHIRRTSTHYPRFP